MTSTVLYRPLPSSTASDHHHRHDPVPLPVEVTLRVVERAQHRRIVAVHELGALGDPSREPADGHEGPGHLAAIHIGVGVARGEELLEQRKGELLGVVVKRFVVMVTAQAKTAWSSVDDLEQSVT